MEHILLQTANRDHDRYAEYSDDALDFEYSPEYRQRQRQEARTRRQAVNAEVESIRRVSRAKTQLHEAEIAHEKLLNVWRVADIEERRAIEPKLFAAMDRVERARAKVQGVQSRTI